MRLKITGGTFKGRMIDAPKGSTTRPTAEKLRKTLFDICQNSIEETTVLDIFAGSGAIGIEAISRGATICYFIESDFKAQTCIQENLESFGIQSQAKLLKVDALKAIDKLGEDQTKFHFIFMDPPYATNKGSISIAEKVLVKIDQFSLLLPEGTLFLEEGRYFNQERVLPNLKHLKLKNARKSGDSQLFEFTC